MNQRLEGVFSKNSARLERLTGSGRETPPTGRREQHRQWRFSETVAPGAAQVADDYFVPDAATLNQITAFIFNAPHVRKNPQYCEVAGKTVFSLKADDAEVNACAYQSGAAQSPQIQVYGGCVVFSRLCGLAQAAGRQPGLGRFCRGLGSMLREQGGQMNPESARQQARQLGLDRALAEPAAERQASSVAAGVVAGIIAHELGHVVYGHVYSPRPTLEISRNMERDADSFAASVINSSPWGDYSVAGMIVWDVALAWNSYLHGSPAATTHPHAAERALDLVRANESQAHQAGLDERVVRDALPSPGDA